VVTLAGLASPLAAQGPGFQVGHLFTDPPATSYRLGTAVTLLGPLGAGMHATVVDGQRPMGNLWGLGLDLSLFHSGRPGLYLLGGVEGGLATHGTDSFWGSWSAGLGYEIIPLGGVSLAAEGRYRKIGAGGYNGVEIGLRLGLDRGTHRSGRSEGDEVSPGGRSSGAVSPVAPEPAAIRTELDAAGVPSDRASLISGVVQTALDVMGMPYRWGDQGEAGFDCSGLIRYAFGKHGITLPRRSADQAREGEEVGRDLDLLRAGDVLTFATSGDRISHVGLYLGNGRFIHSASQGVQISILSPDDASGRWWFKRWVGARRIVG
jgi:cell wall-associated NlpC family hydrolase